MKFEILRVPPEELAAERAKFVPHALHVGAHACCSAFSIVIANVFKTQGSPVP